MWEGRWLPCVAPCLCPPDSCMGHQVSLLREPSLASCRVDGGPRAMCVHVLRPRKCGVTLLGKIVFADVVI